MILEACNLSVRRAGVPPLDFPDLRVEEGQRVLLLGPSGSGKTTLLSVIAGLLKPDAGCVVFQGQDIYRISAAQRDNLRGRQMGFVFQTLHLLPSLTVRQNIALAFDMAGGRDDDTRVKMLLAALGLADKAKRKPQALSQGEQQRAAIARAVVNHPALVIADEPTSALDDDNARRVMEVLMFQAQENKAALLVATHDRRIADYFDSVVMLDAGRMAA